ncbi:MAG: ShlB/FhaC/HecB family hemolysin secretion/activation protein [Cyanobacteria bacterium J06632_22]
MAYRVRKVCFMNPIPSSLSVRALLRSSLLGLCWPAAVLPGSALAEVSAVDALPTAAHTASPTATVHTATSTDSALAEIATGPIATGPIAAANDALPPSASQASDLSVSPSAQVLDLPSPTFSPVTATPRPLSEAAQLAQVGPPEPPELPPISPDTPIVPQPPSAPPEPVAPPAEDSPRVDVVDIQVVGSTVFNAADFAPVLAEFEGRALTLEDLRRAADAVTQLYLNNGYITSRAVLANQTVTDGIVRLQVIEGRLAEIQIDGAPRLQGYVRDRIALGSGTPLSQIDLENQLRLLRVDPLIDNIEASLRAGEGLGESILLVRVTEADPLDANLVVDTSSPPSVGVVRMGAELTYRNPFGYGDQLTATAYRATTGGSHVYSLTYQAPVNAMNGTITARYLPSNFRIIDPPSIAALNVRGSADVYDISYRQPLIRTPQEEFALSLGFRHRSGRTLISTGFTIDESRTSVIQFGQDYLRRDPQGAWALRSQFSLGTDLFDATSRPSPLPDGQFFSWLGQVQRAQVLSPDNLLILQADVQLSANSLLGSEQFVIGGPQSVRGYNQNARFGDNGIRFSVEDRIVAQRNESGAPIIQIAPFIDMAGVWNSGSATANQQNFLLGTGVGFLYQPIDPLNIRVDVGVPLIKLNGAGDSPQDAFLYLLLNYAL